MWSLLITIAPPDERDLVSAELWEFATTGIEETSSGLRAYFEDSADRELILQAFAAFQTAIDDAVPPISVLEAADRDPVFAGSRFVIVPVLQAARQRVLTPELIVLPIDAAMAFGSGRHETTQLCLTALEQFFQPGMAVFDVGCGSGILALAAQELGAARVVAGDIDESAIAVARRHFSGPLLVGSADCFAPDSADIVICNITGKVADRIALHLKRILRPAGILILSGFTAASPPQNFTPLQILCQGERDDWHCWICNADNIRPSPQDALSLTNEFAWWL